MSKFIPVYEYCKKHNVSKQNVYRWIREGRIPPERVTVEEKVVKRLKIKEEAEPIKKQYPTL